MSATRSPSTAQPYGVARVCRVWEVPRSSLYAARERASRPPSRAVPRKRGPRTILSDTELARAIRDLLREVEDVQGWRGEGYRKVWARLRVAGTRVGRRRVLRVMREHGLLAPSRAGAARGPRVHDGTIVTARPDTMWGTDATTTFTLHQGPAWIFAVVDHCTGECLGIHASLQGTRFEAFEPVLQAVHEVFGKVETGVAAGLAVRHDQGSQYTSRHFQRELVWLGIESSPSFVRAPEGNGIAERFFRTLKEQIVHGRIYRTIDEVRAAVGAFIDRYNAAWLIEKNGLRSPRAARAAWERDLMRAAA